MLFKRAGKWAVIAVSGLLLAGLIGLGTVYAQGPRPQLGRAKCPIAGPGPDARGMGWRWGACTPEALAEALGMTPEELLAAVRGGETLAELAEAKGVSIEQLVEKVLAARQARIDEAVEAGRLTPEQAESLKAQMREQMAERLQNGTCNPGAGLGPAQGGRGRWGGGRAFGRGMRRAG